MVSQSITNNHQQSKSAKMINNIKKYHSKPFLTIKNNPKNYFIKVMSIQYNSKYTKLFQTDKELSTFTLSVFN